MILGDGGNAGLHLFDQLSTWTDIKAAITWWGTSGNPAKFRIAYELSIFNDLSTWTDVLTVINNVVHICNEQILLESILFVFKSIYPVLVSKLIEIKKAFNILLSV